MICPVSSAHISSVSSCLQDSDVAFNFEQTIVSVILFTTLFANRKMLCCTSAVEVSLVLSYLRISNVSAADFEQVIVPVIRGFLLVC